MNAPTLDRARIERIADYDGLISSLGPDSLHVALARHSLALHAELDKAELSLSVAVEQVRVMTLLAERRKVRLSILDATVARLTEQT